MGIKELVIFMFIPVSCSTCKNGNPEAIGAGTPQHVDSLEFECDAGDACEDAALELAPADDELEPFGADASDGEAPL